MRRISLDDPNAAAAIAAALAAGESAILTRAGADVGRVSPSGRTCRSAADAIRKMRAFRARHAFVGLDVRDLIDEGRRR
jgi:antitoxin (DNA-binding transcriptional repressor) of toxin-antitoxin stability system